MRRLPQARCTSPNRGKPTLLVVAAGGAHNASDAGGRVDHLVRDGPILMQRLGRVHVDWRRALHVHTVYPSRGLWCGCMRPPPGILSGLPQPRLRVISMAAAQSAGGDVVMETIPVRVGLTPKPHYVLPPPSTAAHLWHVWIPLRDSMPAGSVERGGEGPERPGAHHACRPSAGKQQVLGTVSPSMPEWSSLL